MASLMLTVTLEVEVFYHRGQRFTGEDESCEYPDGAETQTRCPPQVAAWAADQAIQQFLDRATRGDVR